MSPGEVAEESRKQVLQTDLISSFLKRSDDLPEKYSLDRIISILELYLEYFSDRHNTRASRIIKAPNSFSLANSQASDLSFEGKEGCIYFYSKSTSFGL